MKRETFLAVAGCWILALTTFFGPTVAGAREVSPDERMLWSCYMICWPLNRDYHGFYDRPLERPSRDGTPVRLVDLRRATEAGVDALSIDLFIGDKFALPAFGELVKLVNEHHLPIQLSPMFDGLADPNLSLDDVAAKVQQWFERFAHERCVARVGGKPVIFTFGASDLKPAQWETLWQRLHAAGCDGYWIAELSHFLSVGESPDFAGARPWLDLFPAANSFNVHSGERAGDMIRGYTSLYPAGRTWVAPVSIGYWRPEIAVYTSQHGTSLFRDTWQAIADSKVRWVQQSTWNDFGENHHIMPSENYGTTFVELNAYLAQQWKGRAQEPERARFYVSQSQEVQVGEEAEFELLAIVPARDLPATMRLQVFDSRGQCVHSPDAVTVEKTGLQVATIRLPVAKSPPSGLLFPNAVLFNSQGALARVDVPCLIVIAAGYRPERNFSWLHTSSSQPSAGTISPNLEMNCGPTAARDQSAWKPDVRVRVKSPYELADVEILHDGRQILSLRRDVPQVKLDSPVVWEGLLATNRRGLLDWGMYTVRAITVDGRVATGQPIFVERPREADVTLGHWTFDADSDRDVLDSSPWLHDGRLGGRPRRQPWFPAHVADPWGGKCLQFDGMDDRVLLEGGIVPAQAYTVECWIKPAARSASAPSGQILFGTANAAVVLSLDRQGHLQVTRKSDGRWHGVVDGSAVVMDQWQHVAATYDGSMLRLYRNGQLCAERAAPGQGKSGQVAMGYNSVTEGSFYCGCLDEVRLSAGALSPEQFGPHNPLREAKSK